MRQKAHVIDALIQGAAALLLLVFFMMLLTSGREYAVTLAVVALIAALYFGLGAIDSALGGEG